MQLAKFSYTKYHLPIYKKPLKPSPFPDRHYLISVKEI